jgi:antitoxin component of RelBE/YafQ-DinJ toxin-antitoxin module
LGFKRDVGMGTNIPLQAKAWLPYDRYHANWYSYNKSKIRSTFMKKIFLLLIILSLLKANTVNAKSDPFLFGNNEQIVVNNRILAKVNGKAISVIDLMKKMDMLFFRQFPEYASSVQARHQFYLANWDHVLQEFIDKELIIADAGEMKLQVNGGDVREEMEKLFGPNIITNLDQVGLTFDEAWKMVHADITIRRMLFFKVQLKALKQVTPQAIRDYYEQYAKENIRDNEWHFQVVSIRDHDQKLATKFANDIHQLLEKKGVPLTQLHEVLNERKSSEKVPLVNISEEFCNHEKELSDAFKNILCKLQPGSYSQPLEQKSRADNATVYRIFYLKSMIPGGVIPFNEIENQINEKLLEIVAAKETEAYLAKLRQHFDVQDSHLKEMISENFQPFLLK